MSLEKIKILIEIIQNIFVIFGVVIGGAWSLIIFKAKKESELARVDYERKKKDLLEFRRITIDCKPTYYKFENSWKILLDVSFQNNGNDVEIIYWEEENFKVCRVWVDKTGNVFRENFKGYRLEHFPGQELGIRLSPGIKVNKNFICLFYQPCR